MVDTKTTPRECVCQRCGKVFMSPGNRGPAPGYCSVGCRRKPGVCVWCGSLFSAMRADTRYCSACRNVGARNRLVASLKGIVRVCSMCGKGFTPTNPIQRFCSHRCSNRHWCIDKRIRRTKQHVEEVTLEYLFQRDKGACGICKRKVSREYAYPHTLSPSVDHVIPLSRGGLHVKENTQLSHLGCNSRKHARVTSLF